MNHVYPQRTMTFGHTVAQAGKSSHPILVSTLTLFSVNVPLGSTDCLRCVLSSAVTLSYNSFLWLAFYNLCFTYFWGKSVLFIQPNYSLLLDTFLKILKKSTRKSKILRFCLIITLFPYLLLHLFIHSFTYVCMYVFRECWELNQGTCVC